VVVKIRSGHNRARMRTSEQRESIHRTGLVAAAALAALVMTAAPACHWLRYHDLARTHVDLMERIANDAGAAIAESDYRLRPADLQTMAYPLERAAGFLDETAGRREDTASWQRLGEFIAAYQELYEYLDRVRTTPDEGKRARKVDALIRAVNERAAAVRAALDEETS